MLWTDERIRRKLESLYGNGGLPYATVAPIMQEMRDEYEKSVKRVTELTAELDEACQLLIQADQEIGRLKAQLAAVLATIAQATQE